MGKGDIRTRRGKVWRGTYGVTRPRRYKVVIKPSTRTRNVKSLKDLPKAASEAVAEEVVENAAEETSVEGAAKKTAKKAPAAKKPAAKKAPAKKD